ncbi:MAG TPA: Fe-S protein assembly co-chaperone HscB [Gammaproteobacteria bacterium]
MADDLFSKNYFEIFDVPVAVDVDINRVNQIYRELQKAVHPDRFASDSEQARRIAMQQTSLVNQAFQTLKDPVARAQYILKLEGMDINAETDTTMDAEFLMEQMEFRESLTEVRDTTDPLAKLDAMAVDLNNKLKKLMNNFASHISDKTLDNAREDVRKMQFLVKAKKEVDELSQQLEDELL